MTPTLTVEGHAVLLGFNGHTREYIRLRLAGFDHRTAEVLNGTEAN